MTRKRIALLFLLAVAAAVIFVIARRRDAGPLRHTGAPPISVASKPVHRLFLPIKAPPEPTRDFSINDIWLEKNQVCRGEQTRIRVTPRHRNPGEAGWLVPTIGDSIGWETAYSIPRGEPGLYEIPIRLFAPETFGDNSARRFVEDKVYVELKDCVAPWLMTVSARALPSDDDTSYELSTFLRSGPGFEQAPVLGPDGRRVAPAAPPAVLYEWDFGDGQSASTREPRARHDFPSEAKRGPADGAQHTYAVRVRAIDANGHEIAHAGNGLTLQNRYSRLKRLARRIQLHSSAPLLPTRVGDQFELAVTLENWDHEEVAHLERATATLVACDGKSLGSQPLDLAGVFARPDIAAGAFAVGRLKWSASAARESCLVKVQFSGSSTPGGYDIVAFASMTIHESVAIPATADQLAAFNRARALLGTHSNVISTREMQRLENEGRLASSTTIPGR